MAFLRRYHFIGQKLKWNIKKLMMQTSETFMSNGWCGNICFGVRTLLLLFLIFFELKSSILSTHQNNFKAVKQIIFYIQQKIPYLTSYRQCVPTLFGVSIRVGNLRLNVLQMLISGYYISIFGRLWPEFGWCNQDE